MVDIGKGFEKNQTIMSKTIGKIDNVISSASSNLYCYILLFVIVIFALLYKMSK